MKSHPPVGRNHNRWQLGDLRKCSTGSEEAEASWASDSPDNEKLEATHWEAQANVSTAGEKQREFYRTYFVDDCKGIMTQ